MSAVSDKASGLANEALGKIKQGIGAIVGSDKLKGEGATQELYGQTQHVVGDGEAALDKVISDPADRESRVRDRAYWIWQEEGEPMGREHEHWRRAEYEIDAQNVGAL